MIIYLIRHGETAIQENGDVLLTDKGHLQADITGQRLRLMDIGILYSSTMPRAVQTAQHIVSHLQVSVEYRDALQEIDMGDCFRQNTAYIKERHPEFFAVFQTHEWDSPIRVANPAGMYGGVPILLLPR